MAKLIVQPGSPTPWEIQLQAGSNSLGRGPANDFKLDDPSVSGTHCRIVMENGNAVITDLGSTNGTYVNRARVKEAVLQPGQTIHLGGLELMYCPDGFVPARGAQAAAAPRPAPGMPPLPPPRAVGPASGARGTPAATVNLGRSAPPAPVEAPPVESGPAGITASGPCKHHPKLPGRFYCSRCQLFFCEACVTTRAGKRFCRHCGAECEKVQVLLERAAGPKGFFSRFPGAFIYPFRGAGVMWLIVSAIVVSFAESLTGAWWSILLAIAAYGYIFAFMQNIIHATANEEDVMPGLPGLDDVFGCAFRFGVTVMFCFGFPVVVGVLRFFGVWDVPGNVIIATMVFGCLYFPMAFLAVAMKDTALAANPLVVIPAILKVPLGYLVTAGVVIGMYLVRQSGNLVAGAAQGEGYHTREMSTMFITFGIRAVWSLVSVYLLIVSMRTMGLLYVTNKHKFGWFEH